MEIQLLNSATVREHNNNVVRKPNFSAYSIKRYIVTRFTSLAIDREEFAQHSWKEILNPFSGLNELSAKQWNFFAVGFLGWTWDAFDYFAVSLNVSSIAESLDASVKDVTWGITLVLMLRSVGALIFGIWGDKYGRKWPYIVNLALLVVLQIGLGFVKTYKQFLGVRALFGIAMGGMFGNCAAIALDDCPRRARGVILGMFQEGYALGYLLVVVFQRAITDTTSHGWRSLFWFSAGPPVIFLVWRFFLPETDAFIKQQERRAVQKSEPLKFYQLSAEGKTALKQYWLILIYTVLLMSGFNFMSHGSQDLYPTLLTKQLHYGPDRSTVTNSVANLGAIFGGVVFGHLSSIIGRRLAILIAVVLGGAMIYPWAFVRSSAINAGVFFLQCGVQGAWGVVPIHLSEMSPPQFRSFVTGVAYQLGNLCSSASSTIEATIGARFPIKGEADDIYDYAKVMAIFMGCVFGYMLIITFVGPEYRNANLDVTRDDIMELNDGENKDFAESMDEALKPKVLHNEKVESV